MTTHPAYCPHCGQPTVAGGRFCSSCGEPLSGPVQPASLLTDPSDAEPTVAEPAAVVAADPIPSPQPGSRRRGLRYALIGGIAALALAVGMVVLLAGGGDKPAKHPVASGPSAAELARAVTDSCVTLWNADDNQTYRNLTAGWAQRSGVYVNVAVAADYPDKCLITASAPDLGIAYQFLQASGDSSPLGPFRSRTG